MFKHLRPVWAEVNLDNLAHNMREIRKISKSKDIIAVIKADGYGHGALDIAPTLLENGATKIAVAVLNEAIELRRGGIKAPIIILGFTPPSLIDMLLRYDIEQTVYSYELAKEISNMAQKKNKKAKIHIALDTGMGRIGFLPNDESVEDVYKISKLPNIIIEGLYSHFSTADEEDKTYTELQLKKFNEFYDKLIKKGIKINIRHIANSAAIIDLPKSHFEAVRPGVILYGYYPSEEVSREKINLKPVMSLKTNIVHIKKLPAGEYIGYGRKFKTNRESIIATLPVGYADGYTRFLFEKAKVIINGSFAPVVGRICMDQCMVDVTDIKNVQLGDEVILLGEKDNLKFDADDIAKLIGTINYEVTCMISKRVPRVYLKSGKVIKIRNYI
ncbi:alanine racemase [Clostridium sp. USBA 49]|uniref:alanine racemase n=1 Tax=Clostridium sp. USBA 49 TaxID=1881060 RepID=UPI0009992696|nr:alanine racemase [Clostridium sp. USBA 49]SKA87163.1 alanine racemase [Clostridium sp. USBA 49]